jgi:hypothetical protein
MPLGFGQVQDQFGRAQAFADTAAENASELVDSLLEMAQEFAPPVLIDSTVTPTLPPGPVSSSLTVISAPVFTLPERPDDFPDAPTVEVVLDTPPTEPTFIDVDTGTLNLPSAPLAPDLALDLDPIEAPTVVDPAAPTLVDIVIPDPIVITIPEAPDFIDTTERIPQPVTYSYTPGEQYGSALLEALKTTIRARINGSTGLLPEVEQAIWDRARTRELNVALANQDDVARTAEARGFTLPPGTMAAQMREAQRDYYAKQAELSRDIAIKQADLEQSNAKATIEQGIALEGQLIQYANQIEQRAFESARYLADNAVQIYNAQIIEVRALTDAFQANATIFKARADVEISRIEIFKAQIQAESLKTQINQARIDQFRALIDASQARVALYRARVDAQRTLVEIEQARVGLFGERVRAYSAQIGGEVARLEIAKTQASVNDSRASVYRTQVEAFSTVADVRNKNARNQIDIYEARVRALTSQFQGYSAEVQAEAERVRAIATTNNSLIERDRVLIQRDVAQYEQGTRLFTAQVGLYEAQMRTNVERGRLASEQYTALRQIASEAAKVGAQVNAQLAASAFDTIKASASIGASEDVNFNYAGEAAFPASPA